MTNHKTCGQDTMNNVNNNIIYNKYYIYIYIYIYIYNYSHLGLQRSVCKQILLRVLTSFYTSKSCA